MGATYELYSTQTRSRSVQHAVVLNSRQTSLPFIKYQRASTVCLRTTIHMCLNLLYEVVSQNTKKHP